MRFLLTCMTLVALFIASYLIWGDTFESLLAGGEAATFLRRFGGWAWLVAILLILSDVILPIPATAVLATLGIVYGPWLGGVIGCAGSLGAGTLAYLVCRGLGDHAARWLLGEKGFQRSNAFFTRCGGWTVALSRWMIILPEMISCLAGLTRMPARLYFTALACGSVPMCFTYAFIGHHYGTERPLLALSLSAAVPVLLWPIAQMLLRRSTRARDGAE